MRVNLATTNTDGDIETYDIPITEVAQMLVTDTRVCTGFMSFQCDDDHDHHEENLDEDRDVLTLQAKLLDGSDGTLVFAAHTVFDITVSFMKWLNELHEVGRCGCGDHEGGE